MRKWIFLFIAVAMLINLAIVGMGCSKKPEPPKQETPKVETPAPAPAAPAGTAPAPAPAAPEATKK